MIPREWKLLDILQRTCLVPGAIGLLTQLKRPMVKVLSTRRGSLESPCNRIDGKFFEINTYRKVLSTRRASLEHRVTRLMLELSEINK